MNDFEVGVIGPEQAATYCTLRVRMLEEAPLAFAASPHDDLARDPGEVAARLAKPDEGVILGLFTPRLEGAVGLYRSPLAKARHNVHAWGMYVAPPLRRGGAGRALILAAIAHARGLNGVRQVRISVSEAAPEARALYVSVGFRPWGIEPDALCHGGRRIAEEHLVLAL